MFRGAVSGLLRKHLVDAVLSLGAVEAVAEGKGLVKLLDYAVLTLRSIESIAPWQSLSKFFLDAVLALWSVGSIAPRLLLVVMKV